MSSVWQVKTWQVLVFPYCPISSLRELLFLQRFLWKSCFIPLIVSLRLIVKYFMLKFGDLKLKKDYSMLDFGTVQLWSSIKKIEWRNTNKLYIIFRLLIKRTKAYWMTVYLLLVLITKLSAGLFVAVCPPFEYIGLSSA